MKYNIPTLMALRQASDTVCHFTNNIKDCQLLHQAKKPSLSEASVNQRVKATVSRSARSRLIRSTKDLVPKGRLNGRPSPIVKSNIQTTSAVSEAGFARFLKEHTSPKHQRVTAGGRIVPMEPARSPNEYVPGQAGDINPSTLNESSENGVYRSAPSDGTGTNQFGIQGGPGAFHIAYITEPAIYSVKPIRQLGPITWINNGQLPPDPTRAMEPFNPHDPRSTSHADSSVSESPCSDATEDRVEQNHQTATQPSTTILPVVNESLGMEEWLARSSTSLMENMHAVLPDMRGALGANEVELGALFLLFQARNIQVPLEFVGGVLTTILLNMPYVWYLEQWLQTEINLKMLASMSEQRLGGVNMIAAARPETNEDLVRQRCYYTNLRALFLDVHERLVIGRHSQPFGLPCLSEGWSQSAVDAAAEGSASVPDVRSYTPEGSPPSQGVYGAGKTALRDESEGGNVAPGLNTIEHEVMSSADGNVGGVLGCVGLGNQADEEDRVVTTPESESALPGASVHHGNNQRPSQGVASAAVPKGTKSKTTRGRKAPILSSIFARLTGRKGAVPRSTASVAVSTAMAGVVAGTTTPTLSPPVGKPGETLSSGRFPID